MYQGPAAALPAEWLARPGPPAPHMVPRWGRRFARDLDGESDTEPPSPGVAWDDGYEPAEDLPDQQHGPQEAPLAAWNTEEQEPQGLERLRGQWQSPDDLPWDEWFITSIREQVTSGFFETDPRYNELAGALQEKYLKTDKILTTTEDSQRPSWVTLDARNKELSQWSPILDEDLGLTKWQVQPLVDLVRKWNDWPRYQHVPYLEASRILAHLFKDSDEGTFRHGTPGPWLNTACRRASETLQYDWYDWNGPQARPSWNLKGTEKGKGKGLEKGNGKHVDKGLGKGNATRGLR